MKLWGPFICLWMFCSAQTLAQRSYTANSVLATGSWYRIGVKQEGVYKVDMALLNTLGITTSNLGSATIKLYGNGGGMLDENNAIQRPDDLFENPIEMNDGGDGLFNGSDYFLFYAPGPHRWLKDSANQSFSHQKNRYSDTSYYYITIGGTGKRIPLQSAAGTANVTVNSYNERYFYENDLVNLVNSGKEWYGEEFNTNLGGNSTRTFTIDWPGLITGQPITLVSSFAARSVGAASSFSARINGQQVQTANIPGVTGFFLDAFATASTQRSNASVAQSSLGLAFIYSPTAGGAQGWLNWFELHGRRNLSVTANTALFFRDWQSVAANAIAGFTIANNGTALTIWDITDPLQPLKMNAVTNASQTNFSNDASRLREYAAFTLAGSISPIAIGKVTNQNLHNSSTADLLIITHSSLLSEAQRLAQFHSQHDAYKTVTVTVDQVYQEFSGGSPDPCALRDFVKMYFDKAGADQSKRPKYLLLFGSASYDYRNRISNNSHLVPGYESANSLEPLLSYTSDDFFGLLEDLDDINLNNPGSTIDIGIGRIPARNNAEAKTMVDKIVRYHDKASLGAWRNQSVFVADDQDQNLHLTDAETVSANANASNPLLNQYKIYLDAFPVVSSSGGARYPAVNDAIVNQVFNGSLIFNYSGHGSYQRLAEESILTQEELNRLKNPNKLPLFITASCDFAPHDDPAKNSLGAGILTGNPNGAIALLTTTRLVFAYSNRVINDNYLQIALKPLSNGQYLTLGESVKQAKNFTSLSSGDLLNNRKFTLLGDPAMRLAFPELRLQLTGINGSPITGSDTLRALQKYTFTGMVTDGAGNPITNFNGTVYPTVYDKAQVVKTLGNDPSSIVTGFNQQSSVLYKGNATVTDGKFSFTFIVPKDINYQTGRGRISLYADNGVTDANGVNTSFYVGGTGNAIVTDNIGPVIKPYLNDDKFMNGGITNENPVLLVKLYDSSGISTSGNGIGHDITAVIDGIERNILVLNDFYTAYQDSYQQGQVLFQLPTLSEGKHSIRIKAWDVANNSSEVILEFVVVKQVRLSIANLRNFPNPFSVSTTFSFEHNQPDTELDVSILIYNEAGALVKRIKKLLKTAGTRNCEVIWNGDDQSGAKLAKGIYIYKVIVVAGGSKTENTQQLILF
ncbi:MAG: type IX secretion system sortase PorU [Bacteroidota bacterium]